MKILSITLFSIIHFGAAYAGSVEITPGEKATVKFQRKKSIDYSLKNQRGPLLPLNYETLPASQKQNILWSKITSQMNQEDVWEPRFNNDGTGGYAGVGNSLHAWTVSADAIVPPVKDKNGNNVKTTHTHGVTAKCRMVIQNAHPNFPANYTGLFSKGLNGLSIPCIIRVSSLNSAPGTFVPGVAVKLLQNGSPSINNHFMYTFIGFAPDEPKNFFGHAVRTEIVGGNWKKESFFSRIKHKVEGFLVPKLLGDTVNNTEKIRPDLNHVSPKDYKTSRKLGDEGGVFHRPLHIMAGHPKVKNAQYPRHLMLVAEDILNKQAQFAKGVLKDERYNPNMKNFKQTIQAISRDYVNSNLPFYNVYIAKKHKVCFPKEKENSPWCSRIPTGSYKLEIQDPETIVSYGKIFIESQFVPSYWADRYLVFQHTF